MTDYIISEEKLVQLMNGLAELPYKHSNAVINFINQNMVKIEEPELATAQED